MTDIFVSYSQKDRAWVERLVNALIAEGWDVWWDLKIRSGEPFDEAIERNLKQVGCVVAVWSTNAVDSKWVRNEASWALAHNKVVSIRIQHKLDLPIEFYHVHTDDFAAWDGSSSASEFRKLVDDIKAIPGPPPAVVSGSVQAELPTPRKPPELPSTESEYLDFDLRVGIEDDQYYVRVIDSPAGPSKKEALHLPFGSLRQPEFLLTLENAVLRGVGRFRGPTTKAEKVLRDFGREMFNAVFRQAADVGRCLTSSLSMIHQQKPRVQGLRLKLRIDPPELAQLPWEYLYDDSKRDYLGLRARSPIVRFLEIGEPMGELEVDGPLNILGMIANPGGEWDELNVAAERERIDKAITPLQDSGAVHFEWVPGQTGEDLLDMMRRRSWHVFHFIGHGGIFREAEADLAAEEPPEGFIVLVDEAGNANAIAANDLKYLLEGDGSLRLAVLNCCEGGRGAPGDAFASPGAALVRSGVPAVIAMQFPISDKAAIELARGFYQSMADNLTLERAMTEARKHMRLASNVEWGIPVLYTASPTGRLFSGIQISPARPTVSAADPAEQAKAQLRALYA